ncbi:ABC transporter E family member 2, partial [Camellia lanceoleosa]
TTTHIINTSIINIIQLYISQPTLQEFTYLATTFADQKNFGRDLSGGELQRFAIAVVAIQNAEIYMFDEPSSYLDVKQRLKAAQVVRSLLRPNREGIKYIFGGFVPTENLHSTESLEEIETYARYKYPTMSKTQGNFKLSAGLLKPDTVEGSDVEIPEFNVSYKPQKISPKFQYQVRNLLHQKIRDSYMHPQFVSDVMKPLQIEQLMDQGVVNLSGGELQRVALCLCLGKVNIFHGSVLHCI